MKNILFALFAVFSFTANAQLPIDQIDMNNLIKDIYKFKANENDLRLAYWFPPEYWEVAAKQFNLKEDEVEMFKSWFEGYTMVMVFHGHMDTDKKQLVSVSEKETRAAISIEFNDKIYKPIPSDEISDNLNALIETIKPMMTKSFGEMGNGMHAFVFDIRDGMNQSLINAYKDTDFEVVYKKESTVFKLPLPSLYPDKPCELDGEMYPSNYNYCPIHGNKLN